jgi:hypothetical protein
VCGCFTLFVVEYRIDFYFDDLKWSLMNLNTININEKYNTTILDKQKQNNLKFNFFIFEFYSLLFSYLLIIISNSILKF